MNTQLSALEARNASPLLAATTLATRNEALNRIADALTKHQNEIFEANAIDLEQGKELPSPILKRLAFTPEKLQDLLAGIQSLIALPDPLGVVRKATELAPSLELRQLTCPIGVIGVIFESRPDAFVQIATLCLKSGNAVLLKGGREALHTNRALHQVIREATKNLPDGWIQLLETREDVQEMLQLSSLIDLLIPRGSNAFVQYIMDNTRIPVMGHAEGLCHAYIDAAADIKMAVALTVDAKTQAVAVCNAIETLLVHRDIAAAFLPLVADALRKKNVKLLGCEETRRILPDILPATEKDWETEYLDYTLSIRIVPTIQEAIAHINRYGSHHTEMIVTRNKDAADLFCRTVDSADVFWNASTRFADGFRFGLGAEVGIATGKLHARGPVGLEGLCTTKWILTGNGQCVAPFVSGEQSFTHRSLEK